MWTDNLFKNPYFSLDFTFASHYSYSAWSISFYLFVISVTVSLDTKLLHFTSSPSFKGAFDEPDIAFVSSYHFTSSKYFPFLLINSRCVPSSTTFPLSITTILSAFWIVESQCAITTVVILLWPSPIILSIAS